MMINKLEIIAEIGWNHMGDLDLAYQMIDAAKNAGATCVKFQYWDPKSLRDGPWDNDGRREIYKKAFLEDDKILKLLEHSNDQNIEFLISVFSSSGAQKMSNLQLKNIKIPSHEVANKKLLEFCSTNFNKIYFSAGAGTIKEVEEGVEILKSGVSNFILMHCVSAYPCPVSNINLNRLNWLKTLHNKVGLSDHTQSEVVPSYSVMLGAEVIEKHFTTDNNLPGRDNKFALNPKNFSVMCDRLKEAQEVLIDHGNGLQDIELDTYKNYRGRWDMSDYESV